jgi:hypothetical protein
VLVQLARAAELLDPAGVHHHQPVGHGQGLLLVVSDVDEGDTDLALNAFQLELHGLAQLEVEGAEGLVQEQGPWPVDQGPSQGDPLLLAAGQLEGLALLPALQLDQSQRVRHPPPDLAPLDLLAAKPEGHVLEDVHVGEQRVLLEDHVDVALERWDADHVAAVEEDLAAGRLLEAGDHPQGGGLAAARGAEHREELTLGDAEVHLLDGLDVVAAAGELLLHADQLDRGQAVAVQVDRADAVLDP